MQYAIISDSSSDLQTLADARYESVPLKIITDEKEYIDDKNLDLEAMLAELKQYKGVSKSSCPNVAEWKEAFGDAEGVFCVAITSGLSGSYNAAHMALAEYLQEHPERKGYVIDSLSAGPEVALLVEKLAELISRNLDFDDIVTEIEAYKQSTHLVFSLESLRNFANNGRVSVAVAKLVGILGIRVVGKASAEGTLEVIGKAKGGKKALVDVFNTMLKNGYFGGKVRIHHCRNEEAAEALSQMIITHFPSAKVVIATTRGLCSFYAEAGGMLVGYEA
ncbi:MAG: DegV family protein [Clostridia bacterium]|nr:DegV family protein [Clostridia bacterium]